MSLFREKKEAKEWIEALSYVVGYPHKGFIPNRAIKIEIEKTTQ